MNTTRTNSGNAVHSRGRSVVKCLSRAIAILLVIVVIGALVLDVVTRQNAGVTFKTTDDDKAQYEANRKIEDVQYLANMKIDNVHYREEKGAF